MEIDEAAAHMEVKNPTPVNEVEDLVVQRFALEPQNEAKARGAFAAIREGLAALAALGHRFHLISYDPSAVVLRFPQMLYKTGLPAMTVESQAQFDTATADGWLPMQPAAPALMEPAIAYEKGDGPLSQDETARMQVLRQMAQRTADEDKELASLEERNHPWPTAKVLEPARPAALGPEVPRAVLTSQEEARRNELRSMTSRNAGQTAELARLDAKATPPADAPVARTSEEQIRWQELGAMARSSDEEAEFARLDSMRASV